MATARSERPSFFEGQYLGAADLAASVDYSRELARELALAGQSWGVCIGLDLVEVANATGGFDYFVLPGMAFDGYGRAIVVLEPAPVAASLFAKLPTGSQRVWLRYDETATNGLRPGWQTCDAGDAFSRVRESFAIEAGPFGLIGERQSGVDLAGAVEPDARRALIAIDADAPLICDGSAPHQTFPADTARWLVPLGCVAWTAGAPGALGERSDTVKRESRTQRRYVGQIAESLLAADGVIRLRDRKTDVDDTKTVDEQCAASAITADDLVLAPDPQDSGKTVDRLIGKELVWVEGHLRVTGDARLWGTRLELRAALGADNGVPVSLQRAAAASPFGGQDLAVTIGATADGTSRLIAGVQPPGGAFASQLQLRNDGRLAIGKVIPGDVKGHTILAYGEGDTSIGVGCAVKKAARLQFAVGAGVTDAAQLGYDDDKHLLRFGVGADLAHFAYCTAAGNLGIRTDNPLALHPDAADVVIRREGANAGVTVLSDPGTLGSLHFAHGVSGSAETRAGSIRYSHATARLGFGTNDAVRATIDGAGNLGLGTEVPSARIDIREGGTGHALKLNADSIGSDDGGAAHRLEIQPNGGGVRWHGATAITGRAALTSDAQLGLGTDTPAAALHVRRASPDLMLDATGGGQASIRYAVSGAVGSTIAFDVPTRQTQLSNDGAIALTLRNNRVGVNLAGAAPATSLHVRGAAAGSAATPENHVALIENTSGADADVLALRIAGTTAGSANNFITFFDANGPVGRIERGTLGDIPGGDINLDQTSPGTFLRLISGGADFAECLPRAADAEAIGPGRIVGIHGGRVSLATGGADALLVTTDRAVVLGNAPADSAGDRRLEQVTMIGQVPVFVEGPVRTGDYIVPAGGDDGCGVAVAPDALEPADCARVVGRAWQSCERPGRRRVLVAVGVSGATPASGAAALIVAQAARIENLELRLSAIEARAG